MKRFILPLLLLCALSVGAQNLQVHYDLGRHLYNDAQCDRQDVTLTFEQFKADATGSWFYFIDLDLGKHGFMGAYTEIAREFRLGKQSPWAAHMEVNGGLKVGKENLYGSRFQTAALVGPAYNGHSADWSKTWSVQAMYKHFFPAADGHRAYASFQVTGVWGLTFMEGRLTCSGFFDLWRGEDKDNKNQIVILTEPQLWYNFNRHVSAGCEVELSNQFIVPDQPSTRSFYVNPTLAVKYQF